MTGLSLSSWVGTPACGSTEAPVSWVKTEIQQLLMSRGPGPAYLLLYLPFCHQRELDLPQGSKEMLFTHREWVERAQRVTGCV